MEIRHDHEIEVRGSIEFVWFGSVSALLRTFGASEEARAILVVGEWLKHAPSSNSVSGIVRFLPSSIFILPTC